LISIRGNKKSTATTNAHIVTICIAVAPFAAWPRFHFDRNIWIVRSAEPAYLTAMNTDTIFTNDEVMKLNDETRWQAVVKRDASLDGTFVFAVSSTGIFCRPSCPAKRPRRENVRFFDNATTAEHAGYRACLRCRPKAADGNPQSALVRAVCRYI